MRDRNDISKATPNVLGAKLSNGINRNAVRPNRKWEIQDGGLQTGSTCISTCRHDRNTILEAIYISMFLMSSHPKGQLRILYDLTGSGKSKMTASKPEVDIGNNVYNWDGIGLYIILHVIVMYHLGSFFPSIMSVRWLNDLASTFHLDYCHNHCIHN